MNIHENMTVNTYRSRNWHRNNNRSKTETNEQEFILTIENIKNNVLASQPITFRHLIYGYFIRILCSLLQSKTYHETDCAFVEKPQFETTGAKHHFFKHLHYNNTYKRRSHKMDARLTRHERRHKTVRFQLGFNTDGTVFVVKKHTQRKQKYKPMLSINIVKKEEIPSNSTCGNVKKVKRRFKFCRKVWKNYFHTSVKNIRRFRKYDCWSKIRQYRKEKSQKKQIGDTG